MFVTGGRTVPSKGVNVKFKRNIITAQCRSVKQGIHNRHTIVLSGMPDKGRWSVFLNQSVAGISVYYVFSNFFNSKEIFKTTGVGMVGVGSYNGVGENRSVNAYTFRKYLSNFFSVKQCGVVCCQMSTGGKYHNCDFRCIAVPLIAVFVN